MNTLLIPTTFSDVDRNTRLYGIKLAREEDFEAHFIYVLEDFSYPVAYPNAGYTPFQIGNTSERRREIFSAMAYHAFRKDILRTVQDPPPMYMHTESGSKPSMVLGAASRINAKMIILSGKDGNKEPAFILNDMDYEIIRDSKVPVWIVTPGAEYNGITHIVLATDFIKEDIDAIRMLLPIAKKKNALITALHVTDNGEFEERIKQRGFLDISRKKTGYDRIRFATVSEKDKEDVADAINDFVNSEKADLVAVIKQDKSFFDKLFRKSTTRSLYYKSDKPVVVFHQHSQ